MYSNSWSKSSSDNLIKQFRSIKPPKTPVLNQFYNFFESAQAASLHADILNQLTPDEKREIFLFSQSGVMLLWQIAMFNRSLLKCLLQDPMFRLKDSDLAAKDTFGSSLLSVLLFSRQPWVHGGLARDALSVYYDILVKLDICYGSVAILFAGLNYFSLINMGTLIAILVVIVISLLSMLYSYFLLSRSASPKESATHCIDFNTLPALLNQNLSNPNFNQLLSNTISIADIKKMKKNASSHEKILLFVLELSHLIVETSFGSMSASVNAELIELQHQIINNIVQVEGELSQEKADLLLSSIIAYKDLITLSNPHFLFGMMSEMAFTLCNLPLSLCYNLYVSEGQFVLLEHPYQKHCVMAEDLQAQVEALSHHSRHSL